MEAIGDIKARIEKSYNLAKEMGRITDSGKPWKIGDGEKVVEPPADWAAIQKTQEAEKKRREQYELVKGANIPRRYESVTIEGIEHNMPTAEARWVDNFTRVRSYIHRLDENLKAGNGITMLGGRGLMKTSLAVAVLRAAIEKGYGGLFFPLQSMADVLRSMWQSDPEKANRLDLKLRTTPLLILDDLGAEIQKDWVTDKIESIIVDRYNDMKSTILTSNLSRQDLKDGYSGRILDRLREVTFSLDFEGKSFRKTLK